MAVPKSCGIPCVQVRKGVHWLRIQVPQELREPLGKREVLRSLKTKSTSEARRKVHAERARIEAEFEECRRRIAAERDRIAPAPVVLSEAEVWALAVKWFVKAEREAQDYHLDAVAVEARLEDRDLVEDPELASPYVQAEVTRLLTAEGIPVSSSELRAPADGQGTSWQVKLHRAIHRASVEHERRLLNRHAGLNIGLNPEFAQLTAGSALPMLKPVARPVTLERLIERYTADRAKARALSPKSELKQVAQLDLFVGILGGKTLVKDIDRERARAVQDALVRLPANASKKFPKLSVKQVLERAPDPKHPPMAPLTINTYLTAFAGLMRYAEREGLINKSPGEGLRIDDRTANKDRRDPISDADLSRIFGAPLFTDMSHSPDHIRPGRAMVPLIALFTGMRLNEICQLTEDDIEVHDGIAVILVRGDAEGNKRVKTAAGERMVPIHSELKRLGVYRHIEAVRRQHGAGARLFPDIKASAATGYYSDPFSKWWASFLTRVGADVGATFHGFRHSFRDAMRRGKLTPEIVRALGGWSTGKTEDDYGDGFGAAALAEAIELIRYPALDLSPLWIVDQQHTGSGA